MICLFFSTYAFSFASSPSNGNGFVFDFSAYARNFLCESAKKSFTKSPLPCAAAAKQRGEEEDADAAARRAMRVATVRNMSLSVSVRVSCETWTTNFSRRRDQNTGLFLHLLQKNNFLGFFSIFFWKESQNFHSQFSKKRKKKRRRRRDFIEVNTRYGHIIFNDRRKNEEEEEEEERRRRRLCRYVFSILCLLLVLVLLLLLLVRIPLGIRVVRVYYATHHERHHEAHRTRFPNVVSFSTRVRLLHVFLMRVLRFDSFGFDENIVARCRRYCVFIDVRVDSCDRSWNRDAEPKWNERK